MVWDQASLVSHMSLAFEFTYSRLRGDIGKTQRALFVLSQSRQPWLSEVLGDRFKLTQHLGKFVSYNYWHRFNILLISFTFHPVNSHLHTVIVDCVNNVQKVLSAWDCLCVLLKVLLDIGIILYRPPNKLCSELLPLRDVLNPVNLLKL